MTRLALAALAALAVLPALATTASPAAAASAPAPVQLEAEAVASRGTAVVQDAAASGRHARLLAPGRSVTVRLTAPAAGSRLVLRVRTAGPGQAPVVTVDGHRVAGLPVPGRTWHDQAVGAGHAKGAHTITITHPPGTGRAALVVDRVGFAAAQARALAPVDSADEARIVQLVNAARAAAGVPRLTVSACADRFAEDWSATMARTSVLEHRPSLRSVMTACRASGVGENIASGTVSPDQMMAMWMRSPGHRANVLSRRFTHIGVAVSSTPAGRSYGTQNFLVLPR